MLFFHHFFRRLTQPNPWIDIAIFFLYCGLAYSFDWNATNLLWSFWLSSAVVTYVWLLIVLIRGHRHLNRRFPRRIVDQDNNLREDLVSVEESFKRALGRNTFYFLIFQYALLGYLMTNFPLIEKHHLSEWENALLHLKMSFTHYWPILIAGFLASRRSFFNLDLQVKFYTPYLKAVKLYASIPLIVLLSQREMSQGIFYCFVFGILLFPVESVVALTEKKNNKDEKIV